MFLQILRDVSVGHPRRDNCRCVVMVEHAVELEDVPTRYIFPHDRLLTKALFLTESAHAHTLYLLPASGTHLLESSGILLICGPQNLHCHRFTVLCPVVDISPPSTCMRFIGERYRCFIDPIRVREVSTFTRES